MALAMRDDRSEAGIEARLSDADRDEATAINLKWALDEMRAGAAALAALGTHGRGPMPAPTISQKQDVGINQGIAGHGLPLIEAIAARKSGEPVNVLTHCNAGWLATVDWGTATAPIYLAA